MFEIKTERIAETVRSKWRFHCFFLWLGVYCWSLWSRIHFGISWNLLRTPFAQIEIKILPTKILCVHPIGREKIKYTVPLSFCHAKLMPVLRGNNGNNILMRVESDGMKHIHDNKRRNAFHRKSYSRQMFRAILFNLFQLINFNDNLYHLFLVGKSSLSLHSNLTKLTKPKELW